MNRRELLASAGWDVLGLEQLPAHLAGIASGVNPRAQAASTGNGTCC